MNRYFFIINPVSRKRSHTTKEIIETFFQSRNETIEIAFWTAEKKVDYMVNQAIEKGFDTVVACGGDGTILEVGKALIDHPLTMGILPMGSGNGIARHFRIPTKLQNALQLLVTQKTQQMDVGKANDHCFFGNIGFGIEVDFIHAYQKRKIHGLLGYCIAFWRALFVFRFKTFELIEEGKNFKYTPYTLMISNTNEQGYGRTLTPTAVTNDGMLNLAALPKQNWLKLSSFMLQIGLFKRPLQRKNLFEKEITQLQIKAPSTPFSIQIDGEYIELKEETVSISVLKGALDVITG